MCYPRPFPDSPLLRVLAGRIRQISDHQAQFAGYVARQRFTQRIHIQILTQPSLVSRLATGQAMDPRERTKTVTEQVYCSAYVFLNDFDLLRPGYLPDTALTVLQDCSREAIARSKLREGFRKTIF